MIFIGENLRYDFIHIRLCYWQYLFHCIKFFLLFCRKNIIGPQKKRKLLKQFGKKSLDANIAAIYVGGTSIMKRLVRSLHKDEFKHKSRQASNNRRSETGAEGNGMSRHLGCSKSIVEHAIDLVNILNLFYLLHFELIFILVKVSLQITC